MGKHERGFERVDKDLYPTPAWVVAALAEYLDLDGKVIWEGATGTGKMAEALKAAGAAVYCSDIVRRDYPLNGVFDFTTEGNPPALPLIVDLIVTNPAYGQGN